MAAQRPFTGKHMLLVMVAFFGVIIAVNVTLAVFANGSWTGLVVKNSYVASQKFNQAIDAARAQDAMGWQAVLTASPEGLRVALSGRDKSGITGMNVQAKIGRPVAEAFDQIVQLSDMGAGIYTAGIDLAPGQWQAELVVSDMSGLLWRRQLRFEIARSLP